MKRLAVCENFCIFLLLFLLLSPTCLVSAEEEKQQSQVFDLGDVLIMDKGDEINSITTTETVSSEDIEMQGAQTAAEALELVPGIDIQTGGKGQSFVKLRGFDQKQIRVLIDGVPAHESYDGSLALELIPADAIAKIKVIKGASSVLYGPNTMGGVINIITKKGGEKPYTSVTTSFGANDTQNYIVNHGAANGNWNYWVTAGHRTSDGYELSDDFNPNNSRTGLGTQYNEDGGVRDLSYYTKNTFNSKIGYEYDADSKVYLSFDYHENEKGIPTSNYRYWEFSEWNQWQLSLAGEHDVTDILSLKGRIYYVDHDDTVEDVGGWDVSHTTATNKKWFERSSYEDYTLGGEVQAYLDFGDVSLLKMGASYMKDNHLQQDYYDATTRGVVMSGASIGYQPQEEYEADIYSFGIEDEVRLFNRLTLNAGVSYDLYDPIKNYKNYAREDIKTWNPQAGLSFDVTEDFNLYASVGKKTRFPQLKELYSVVAGGNSSLNPEKNIAYEIGAKKRFNKVFDGSLAAFFNDIDDRIVYASSVYSNVAESEIKGIETLLNIKTPWNLDATLGYTFLSSKEKASPTSTETDAVNIPDRKATLDLRYAFDFGLTASFQTIYTGDQLDSNRADVNDFVVCNAKLVQKLPFSKIIDTDLFIEAANLFDEDYEEGNGPTAGRTVLVGMKLSF
jgi:iron complex outermembrane receptor protein/outer membrane receptor for ferrienterochelin and colicins